MNNKLQEVKQTSAVTIAKEEVMNQVTSKIAELKQNNDIAFPPTYSVTNAINSAWLMLQDVVDKAKKPALEVCTKQSIVGTLYNMCLQGISPAKKQCYFVVYGNQLQLMRSYMGTVAVTKRLKGVKDVKAYCIYEGDVFEREFDFETGTFKITKFEQDLDNQDITKIKGAFAMIIGEKGPLHVEVMTMDQIKAAWNQGYAKGNSGAHKNFTDEMAKKTVINRACKMFANTSDDSDVLIGAFNDSDKADFSEENQVNRPMTVKEEITQNANTKVIDIEEEQQEVIVDVPEGQMSMGDGCQF